MSHRPPHATRSRQNPRTLLAIAILLILGQLTVIPRAAGSSPDVVVVMAAGDIACGQLTSPDTKCGHAATAALVRKADPDAVLTIGDTQYECGDLEDFLNYFDPTWGTFKDKIFPVIGNHEYREGEAREDCPGSPPGAPGYWTYFGDAASPLEPGCRVDCSGYYSFDLGTWHIVALNSNCSKVPCIPGSEQEQWLRADLADHPAKCVLAYFHHPRFSSGRRGDTERVQPLWEALYEAGVDVVLTGHEHNYERFGRLGIEGEPDEKYGIREFIVGTGGRGHTSFRTDQRRPASEASDDTTYGVLRLELRPGKYSWQFVPVPAGEKSDAPFTDEGSDRCHGAPE